MTDRKTLDRMTSDDLDQLYDERGRLEIANRGLKTAVCEVLERAEKAETELAALRQVARGYCPACGRSDAAPTVADWETERQRADEAETDRNEWENTAYRHAQHWRQAEAAIARVRVLAVESRDHTAAGLDDYQIGQHDLAVQILAALDQEVLAGLAQNGVDTPGCDCGHDGMGEGWHLSYCAWLSSRRTAAPAATEATERETTTRVFAALHRSAEEDVCRVIALYEQWVKAGPPPLGVSLSRWWDARLAELHAAVLPPADQPKETPDA